MAHTVTDDALATRGWLLINAAEELTADNRASGVRATRPDLSGRPFSLHYVCQPQAPWATMALLLTAAPRPPRVRGRS